MNKTEKKILAEHIQELRKLSEHLKSAFEMSRQVQMRLAYEQIDEQTRELTKLLTT